MRNINLLQLFINIKLLNIQDRELFNMKMCILQPTEPPDQIKTLIADPLYSNRVRYLKGSSLDFEDLKRAKIKNAVGCFILCDPLVVKEVCPLDRKEILYT